MGALDLLAEEGQWTRCIEKAKQHSGAVRPLFLLFMFNKEFHKLHFIGTSKVLGSLCCSTSS